MLPESSDPATFESSECTELENPAEELAEDMEEDEAEELADATAATLVSPSVAFAAPEPLPDVADSENTFARLAAGAAATASPESSGEICVSASNCASPARAAARSPLAKLLSSAERSFLRSAAEIVLALLAGGVGDSFELLASVNAVSSTEIEEIDEIEAIAESDMRSSRTGLLSAASRYKTLIGDRKASISRIQRNISSPRPIRPCSNA